jgi:hypothetical protein
VGKPNEREREIYYSAQGKYISAAKQHFQPRKIPHSTNSVPQKSASFSMPKPYRCPASSVPCFPCPQSAVWTVPYGPKKATENLKTASKTVPKLPRFQCQIRTIRLYGSIQYGLPQQKNISAKNSQNFFLRNHAHFPRKMCPLCFSLFSLKHTQKISLTILPMSSLDIRHVLHTTQCILL